MGNNCCGLGETIEESYGDLNTERRNRNVRKHEEKARKQKREEPKSSSRNYRHSDQYSFANELPSSSSSDPSVSVQQPFLHEPVRRKVNVVSPIRILHAKKIQPTTKRNCNHEEYEQKLHEFQRYQSCRTWQDEDVVSQATKVPKYVAKNVINLLDEGSTVPFIARYRRDKIVNIPVENIREVQFAYANVKKVHERVCNILKTLAEENIELDGSFLRALVNAKTIEEVEFLYAPFNPENQMSLVEAFEALGFEYLANDILEGKLAFSPHNLLMLIRSKTSTTISRDEVTIALQYVIENTVSKNQKLLDFINNHPEKKNIEISTHRSNEATANQSEIEKGNCENYKFEHYYNFSKAINIIKPHQVLAINRGERQNILIVLVKVSARMKDSVLNKCWLWFCRGKNMDLETSNFLIACFNDAYNNLIEPQLIKQVRTELTKNAIKESVKVFCTNLKRLLLTPPVRGENIIALDPGFKHGCKVAVVACNGNVLQTDVIFPNNSSSFKKTAAKNTLIRMVFAHKASIIALGNGTGCRETELWLSNQIYLRSFAPFEIKYCIVNENGASVYSISEEAVKDLPGMDPNFRSAVSIARRLQDPLSEYVKIEPKHLGVGMYQHDMPEEVLKEALDNVVVECVSFVGVDLNTCSEALLRKVSGLSMALAKQIILWREKNGCFINRWQLLEVKNFTLKCFEQCAGFVKILPSTCLKSKSRSSTTYTMNPLDATVIHPESYEFVESFLMELKSNPHEVGTAPLAKKLSRHVQKNRITFLAEKFNVSPEKLQFVIDVLVKPSEYDIREEFDKPLFKTGIRSIKDLTMMNEVLTGRVVNVTHFGAFVDIGVGKDGLIHTSKMQRRHVALGDTVSVIVLSVDAKKGKIALKLID